MSDENARERNPLLIPLVAMTMIALILGVALIIVLMRGSDNATREPQPAAPTAAQVTAIQPAPAERSKENPTAPVPHGKVGQRVESGGLAITVEKVLDKPQNYPDQVRIGSEQRYLALLLAVENHSGGNLGFFPSQLTLRDEQGFSYDQLGLHGTIPVLEWRTLGNRETLRGYADFVVPKAAKGLTLVYSNVNRDDAQPIYIELRE